MGLPVAVVVFLLKTGIKQLDKDYSMKSFTEDVLGAFGEKAGNHLTNLISESRYVIDNMLKDQRLAELGIDDTKTAQVREEVKDILKYIKISDTMLSDHDCDAEEITKYIISNYASKISIGKDETAIRDIKRVLFEIIQTSINLAQQNSSFINGIIFDIHKVAKSNASDLKEIKSEMRDFSDTLNYLLKLSIENNERERAFHSSQTHPLDANHSQPTIKSEQKAATNPDTLNFLIDYSEGRAVK